MFNNLNKFGIVAINLNKNMSYHEIGNLLNIELINDCKSPMINCLRDLDKWILIYKNNLFICSFDIDDFHFFSEGEFAQRVVKTFSSSKICAFSYYSTIDKVGYSLFENGESIRRYYEYRLEVKEEILENFGEKIDFEDTLYDEENDQSLDEILIEKVTGERIWDLLMDKSLLMNKFEIN